MATIRHARNVIAALHADRAFHPAIWRMFWLGKRDPLTHFWPHDFLGGFALVCQKLCHFGREIGS